MKVPMKSVAPKPEHLAFREALLAVAQQHGRDLQADELLAIVSHLVGQLIALQDQRTMTSEMALQIVMDNIEAGNRDAIDPLMTQVGGRA